MPLHLLKLLKTRGGCHLGSLENGIFQTWCAFAATPKRTMAAYGPPRRGDGTFSLCMKVGMTMETPNPRCWFCGSYFRTWPAVRQHIKYCQCAPRPRQVAARKRNEPSKGGVLDFFGAVSPKESKGKKEKKP